MVNTRYDIPRGLKRRCRNGSAELRSFYDSMFVNDYIAFRGEVDFDALCSMPSEELDVIGTLVNLNLQHDHCVEAAKRIQLIKAKRALANRRS